MCRASYSREGGSGFSFDGGACKGMAFCIGVIFLLWQQRHYSEEGQYLSSMCNKNRYLYYLALFLNQEANVHLFLSVVLAPRDVSNLKERPPKKCLNDGMTNVCEASQRSTDP